ncbi:hypothetical protein CBS101457_006437 [Exobasidium rhododendri]|nr:hypothetical protein CBS101457_006437 [Exobasidium rhododendri]
MEEFGLEPDAPNASSSREPIGGVDNASDSGDEAAPDYSLISSLAAKAQERSILSTTGEVEITPFIPKRGEKDFEPTGFEAQERALEKSRKAMFDVIRCERIIASKNVSIATWEPSLNRAIVELSRGPLFSSIGVARKVHVLKNGRDEDLERYYRPNRADWERDGVWKEGIFYEKLRSRLELLPEEALYMIERGSLECRIRSKNLTREGGGGVQEKTDYDVNQEGNTEWVPMSVQQAFATMLFTDGLNRERYQLYAYLKRLGYIIQRKTQTESLRSLAASKRGMVGTDVVSTDSIIADHQHPLKLVTIIDVLLYPLRRLRQLSLVGISKFSRIFYSALQWLRNVAFGTKAIRVMEGTSRGLLGIGGRKWDRYEDVFDRLRIIPSGHNANVRPRHSSKAQGNDTKPEIFYYAWRPATRFKKTDPPIPEYRLAVVDARVTSLPSVYAFESLFEGLPIPINSEDVEGMDEEEQRDWKRSQEEKKRNDESYGKGAVKKQKATKAAAEMERQLLKQSQQSVLQQSRTNLQAYWKRFLYLLQYINHCYTLLPPGCTSTGAPRRYNKIQGSKVRPVNVFPPLKTGRRNVIVAINDCGTSSLIRFGEAEFDKWRLAGSPRVG